MIYLSSDLVVQMHDVLLERWGGEEGRGHRGSHYEGVEAAVQAVHNSYYESIPELAAAYAVYIVQGHVFMDGNKRTGWAALITFLEANGGHCGAALDQRVAAMIELQARAEKGQKTDDLIAWLVRILRLTSVRP
jgi:death-on-curing protein